MTEYGYRMTLATLIAAKLAETPHFSFALLQNAIFKQKPPLFNSRIGKYYIDSSDIEL